MLRLVEVPVPPRVLSPLSKLPIDVAMMPAPLEHPFDIQRALGALMGDATRARRVFRVRGAKIHEPFDVLHLGGTASARLAKRFPLAPARLILFQVPRDDLAEAASLAELLARDGPAALVVAADDPEIAYEALLEIYAGIVHNQPLTQIVPKIHERGSEVVLAFSRVSDNYLGLGPLLEEYRVRGQNIAEDISLRSQRTYDQALRKLHRSQCKRFELDLEKAVSIRLIDLKWNVDQLVSKIDWSHEGGGAGPLSEALEEMPKTERAARAVAAALDDIDTRIEEEAARAPRVLNANFAAIDGTAVDKREPLLANAEYDLLVDVGPVWDKMPTLVEGAADFPSHGLPPPKEGGWNIDVVFVGEEFVPSTAAATMFVPESGRSHPVSQGKVDPNAGPIRIRLRAPDATALRTARSRLSLSYNGTIIQSAVVAVNVAPKPGTVAENPNRILVDFVLSGSLRDVADVIGTRDVGLSLLMNDDGSGGHRFVLRGAADPLPAFVPYDPLAAKGALDESRQALLDLFFQKDASAKKVERPGIEPDNGKDLQQFKRDLFVLARIGNRLRAGSLPEARPDDGSNSAQWRRSLAGALLSKRIIHIARTHSSSYVYPWSLVYQHALEGDSAGWTYCDVIKEQWPNGRRTGPPEDRCPHNNDPDDHRNVLCPYGFWGLKHIVEQPVSIAITRDGKYDPDANVTTKIASDAGQLHLAVGVTRDVKLDAKLIGTHLAGIRSFPAIHFEAPEAETAEVMLTVSQRPQIVYVLCHGMYDPDEKSIFLGIGPADNRRDHRIYPSMLDDWTTRSSTPNLAEWTATRPLVFINGCETLDATPDQMLSFVSAFSNVPAGGVVGTEVSVQLPVAAEFARVFFEQLLGQTNRTVGEAMRNTRWELANRGNLLGLSYTMYCMANLQFV